jgi:predicted nuclease of restriction endonuclease-like (RecB) superfamily
VVPPSSHVPADPPTFVPRKPGGVRVWPLSGLKRPVLTWMSVHGRTGEEASFPVPPALREMPHDYALTLEELKARIQEERLRVVLSANAAMVLLYWDIGCVILDRQQQEGWGAKVIDRLSADLRQAFPDMRGLSPRNLKYMRAFASTWPERRIVQEVLAQITWYHNIALLEKLDDAQTRLWYARKTVANGWN